MKKMANGGVVTPDYDEEKLKQMLTNQFKPSDSTSSFNVAGGDTTTKTAALPPAQTEQPQKPTDDLFTPPDLTKPEPTNAPDQKDVEQKVTSSHPGLQPDALSQEVKQNIAQTNQYGPEQEKAVMQNVLDSQNSLGSKIARGGAAFSDALMQGVARAGNPGNLQNMEDQEQKRAEMQVNAIPKLQEMSGQQINQRNTLEGMTDQSPLGKATALAYQKVFKNLFPQMSDSELAALTKNPSVAAKIFPEMGPVIDKQVQNELKKMQIEATVSNQKQEREQADKKLKADHPFLNMAGKLDGDTTSGFDHSSIPSGTVYKAPDGTMRKKK